MQGTAFGALLLGQKEHVERYDADQHSRPAQEAAFRFGQCLAKDPLDGAVGPFSIACC